MLLRPPVLVDLLLKLGSLLHDLLNVVFLSIPFVSLLEHIDPALLPLVAFLILWRFGSLSRLFGDDGDGHQQRHLSIGELFLSLFGGMCCGLIVQVLLPLLEQLVCAHNITYTFFTY